MNIRTFNSWLLIICPISMVLVWAVIEPILVGTIDESLAPSVYALDYLELASDNEFAVRFINMLGLLFLSGTMTGLALLGRSLQGNGSGLGSLAAFLFPVGLAVPVIAVGLSLEAYGTFAAGFTDDAVSLELLSGAVWSGMPLFWGLGFVLLGLGIVMEKTSLPVVLGALMALVGGLLFIGLLLSLNDGLGFVVFLLSILITFISGVVLLRRSD